MLNICAAGSLEYWISTSSFLPCSRPQNRRKDSRERDAAPLDLQVEACRTYLPDASFESGALSQKRMLTDYVGALSPAKLTQLRAALLIAFDIDDDPE
jgi:hypothetical protein